MDMLDRLKVSSREYTPIPFWFLNGDLRHEEIRRQLRDFRDHGIYGVVTHPRIGLPKRIPYLSKTFFSYMRTAVETAAELDMKVVLYDEGMYPSGSACGLVVRDHPEWASRGIVLTKELRAGDVLLARVNGEEPLFLAERPSGGTLRGIHFGQDDGEPWAPPTADILNPQAVNRFIELTHEAYYREFSGYFGTTIIGFFTDEPSILGRNAPQGMLPWTAGFADEFLREGGRLEGLTALFRPEEEENADTALYRHLILKREEEVYYGSLSRWCESHGIALMGHPHQSDDIEVEKYFHVPGQDLVLRWIAPEKGGLEGMDTVMGKCSADMARLMGRKRNSNECFGACNRENNPWYFTGADMKWYTDWLAVRGVNLFIPHAFYYSLKGKRSGERPPDVGPGSIWWPHYRMWADYMARLSMLMSETEAQASVAVLCRNRDLRADEVKPLFESQRSFQYLPESFWADCRVRAGNLIYRDMRFQAVMDYGKEQKPGFEGVSRDPLSVAPDCVCDPPQPSLRVARLRCGEREMWFCVNEGLEAISASVTLPASGQIGQYDLWNNRFCRTGSGKEGIQLQLDPYESVLLFACLSDEEWQALPEKTEPAIILTNQDFRLVREEREQFRKIYEAEVSDCGGDLLVSAEASEMAELYVNGAFAGVAFWAPQKIRVPAEMLDNGSAKLQMVVTGSLANRYGNRRVPYGLNK